MCMYAQMCMDGCIHMHAHLSIGRAVVQLVHASNPPSPTTNQQLFEEQAKEAKAKYEEDLAAYNKKKKVCVRVCCVCVTV